MEKRNYGSFLVAKDLTLPHRLEQLLSSTRGAYKPLRDSVLTRQLYDCSRNDEGSPADLQPDATLGHK
jgi:hypothetical protein